MTNTLKKAVITVQLVIHNFSKVAINTTVVVAGLPLTPLFQELYYL